MSQPREFQVADTPVRMSIARDDGNWTVWKSAREVRIALNDACEAEIALAVLPVQADDPQTAAAICAEIRRFAMRGGGSVQEMSLRAANDATYTALVDAARTVFAPPIRRAAVIVDVQNGFINEHTQHIPDRIAALLDAYTFERCIFTRYLNIEDSPFEVLMGWSDMHNGVKTEIVDLLLPYAAKGEVIVKYSYSGLTDELITDLRAAEIDELVIVGLETDACVLKTAFDAFEATLPLTVITDLCATMEGQTAHQNAIALMQRNLGWQNVLTRAQFDAKTKRHATL